MFSSRKRFFFVQGQETEPELPSSSRLCSQSRIEGKSNLQTKFESIATNNKKTFMESFEFSTVANIWGNYRRKWGKIVNLVCQSRNHE